MICFLLMIKDNMAYWVPTACTVPPTQFLQTIGYYRINYK